MALLSVTIMLLAIFKHAEASAIVVERFRDATNVLLKGYSDALDTLISDLEVSEESKENLLTYVNKTMGDIGEKVDEEVENISDALEKEAEDIKETLLESLQQISGKLQESIKEISDGLLAVIQAATGAIAGVMDLIINVITGSLNGVTQFVEVVFNPDEGGVKGDPHFRMWGVNSNSWFPYHGECDLVLIDNPKLSTGKSLRIHVRTKIKSYYSYVESVAIQIDEEVLEILANKEEVFVNRKGTKQTPTLFAGYQIKEANTTEWCRAREHEGAVMKKINLSDDGKIIVVNCWGFLYVDVQARGLGFLHSTGLMGRRDQPGKFARNGTILFNNIFYAEEWQVLLTEPKLFHVDRQPQHPNPCIPPPKQVQRRVVHRRVAMMVCSDLSGGSFEACMYDVEATGNVNMAVPYSLRY